MEVVLVRLEAKWEVIETRRDGNKRGRVIA